MGMKKSRKGKERGKKWLVEKGEEMNGIPSLDSKIWMGISRYTYVNQNRHVEKQDQGSSC